MVKTIPEKTDDGILIYLVKCNCMKVYFDEDGWKTCIDTMACKKQQCTCETCHKLISGTVVCCSTCKKWYHDACQNASKEDLKKNNGIAKVARSKDLNNRFYLIKIFNFIFYFIKI